MIVNICKIRLKTLKQHCGKLWDAPDNSAWVAAANEIIKNANEADINGFKKILYSMIDQKNQIQFNKLNM